MFEIIEYAVTIVIAILSILIARGFFPIFIKPDKSAVWYLSAAIICLEVGVAIRAFYWVAFPHDIKSFFGRPLPNIIFGALLIYGGIQILKLLLMIIPEKERSNYNILTAPFYPRSWAKGMRQTILGIRNIWKAKK